MLNTALLSRMSQKSQHTRYEEIILGRIRCEKALQVVRACPHIRKLSRDLVRIVLLVGHSTKLIKNAYFGPNLAVWGPKVQIFWEEAKVLVPT